MSNRSEKVKQRLEDQTAEFMVERADVVKSTAVVTSEIEMEHLEKLGDHGINVLIGAEEARLEKAMDEHGKAQDAANKAINDLQAKIDDEIKHFSAVTATKAAVKVCRQAVKVIQGLQKLKGAVDLKVPEPPEKIDPSIKYVAAGDDAEDKKHKHGYFRWTFDLSTRSYESYPISGKVAVPKSLIDKFAEMASRKQYKERIAEGIKELRRRLQRIGSYERRLKGQLSSVVLNQTDKGKEILGHLQQTMTAALPQLPAPKK